MLGDIVLANGVCEREAAEKAIPVETHATHLLVHGTLHLLGYDHQTTIRRPTWRTARSARLPASASTIPTG